MILTRIRPAPHIQGFPSKTNPQDYRDYSIHPKNTAFDARVRSAVAALRSGQSSSELIEVHGSVVVRAAEKIVGRDGIAIYRIQENL